MCTTHSPQPEKYNTKRKENPILCSLMHEIDAQDCTLRLSTFSHTRVHNPLDLLSLASPQRFAPMLMNSPLLFCDDLQRYRFPPSLSSVRISVIVSATPSLSHIQSSGEVQRPVHTYMLCQHDHEWVSCVPVQDQKESVLHWRGSEQADVERS